MVLPFAGLGSGHKSKLLRPHTCDPRWCPRPRFQAEGVACSMLGDCHCGRRSPACGAHGCSGDRLCREDVSLQGAGIQRGCGQLREGAGGRAERSLQLRTRGSGSPHSSGALAGRVTQPIPPTAESGPGDWSQGARPAHAVFSITWPRSQRSRPPALPQQPQLTPL